MQVWNTNWNKTTFWICNGSFFLAYSETPESFTRNLNVYNFSIIGKHEATGCWYLEMWHQKLPYHSRRRCLDLLNHCCCLSSISHQKIEGNEGLVKIVLYFYSVRACQQQKRVNKNWNKKLVLNQLFFQSKFQMCHYTPTPLVWCLLFCASSSVHSDWPGYSRQGRLSYHNPDQMMWSLWPPYDLLNRVAVSRVEVWIELLHCPLDMRLVLWN